MARQTMAHPLERLGRWNGSGWDPVDADAIGHGDVRILSHGWAPGMRPLVEASPRFLRVWDPDAITAEGARFDRWYAPLAHAIRESDPTATVLAYTWVDQSATTTSRLRGARSQLRTNAAGQTLAVALREALGDSRPRLHLIGHSHGAKVVTVAAALLPEPPRQLTLLDSPENLLPVIGGALNDLSSYLRALPIGTAAGETFVDNYTSMYGIRYGSDVGLGGIVDVALDPERFPIDDSTSPHSYAWLWYLESARDVSRGVGYAWSPLRDEPAEPNGFQLQHPERDGPDPLTLEAATGIPRGRRLEESISQRASRGERGRITTERPVQRGVFWRRSGDQTAKVNLRWLEGPPEASLALWLNGVERWRSTRGWSDRDTRHATIPVGSMRSGIGYYEMRLESHQPASVEITPGTVRTVPVPIIVEYRSWLRPVTGYTLATVSALMLLWIVRSMRRRRAPSRNE